MQEFEGLGVVKYPEFVCVVCKTTHTPMWRKGPCGRNTLCNRCGIKWSRVQNPRKRVKDLDSSHSLPKQNLESLSDDSGLTQSTLSPMTSEKEDFFDLVDDEPPTVQQFPEKSVPSSPKKLVKRDEDLPEPASPKRIHKKKKISEEDFEPSQKKKRIEKTRTTSRKRKIKNYDSDPDSRVPSVLDLLQKIRDSKVLLGFKMPERPLEERQKRFFDHAEQELKKAEEAMNIKWL